MPDLEGLFFRPNQNVMEFVPYVGVLIAVLILVLGLGLLFSYIRAMHIRTMAWSHFRTLANRYFLTRQEIFVIQKLTRTEKNVAPIRWLTSQDLFEHSVHLLEKQGKPLNKKLLNSLREKLFAKNASASIAIRSTELLPPGTRLFIKNMDDPDTVLWGHLVDNDRKGLVVIVPTNREIRTPLRVNTQLEIVAYIHEQNPLIFVSWVKSVIPGPRKMIVLGHSEFLVNHKEINRNSKLIGPHFRGKSSVLLNKSPDFFAAKNPFLPHFH